MALDSFVRSKVARRIVMLFVLCALAPVCVLGILAFQQVSGQLEQASQDRLRQAGKSTGMGIVERLQRAEADLLLVEAIVRERLQPTEVESSGYHGRLRDSFSSVVVRQPDGTATVIVGEALVGLVPSETERAHMARGRSLLKVVETSGGRGEVRLLRRLMVGAEALVVEAAVADGVLWSEETVARPTRLRIVGPSLEHLFVSEALGGAMTPDMASQLSDVNGDVRWTENGERLRGRYWKIPLTYDFLSGPWTVIVSESQADVMAPVNSARRSFLLVMLLSLWVVALLSLVQIRRSLVPLSRLRDATDRVSAGHFDTSVEVRSGDEFEELAGSFNMMSHELGRHFNTLQAVADLERAVLSSLDEHTIATRTIDQLPQLLRYDHAVCLLQGRLPGDRAVAFVKSGGGSCRTAPQASGLSAGDLEALQGETSGTYIVHRGRHAPLDCIQLLEGAAWSLAVLLPIALADGIVGVVMLARNVATAPTPQDLAQARQLTNQMAVALSNARLLGALDRLNVGTLNALARTVDAKSPWTAGHSQRVTVMALRIARELGLPAADLEIIERGGLLHDIGKIAVPSAILNKPGRLTDEEYAVMKEHPRTGARILEPIAEYHRFIPVVEQHHERWDGKGYPDGLAGEDIHLCARVLAVADVFDALTSDRPYRVAMTLDAADDIIRGGSGSHFDPRMVEAYLAVRQRDSDDALAA